LYDFLDESEGKGKHRISAPHQARDLAAISLAEPQLDDYRYQQQRDEFDLGGMGDMMMDDGRNWGELDQVRFSPFVLPSDSFRLPFH
jgi:hypothetical protein